MRFLAVFAFIAAVAALDNGLGRTPAMGWNSWNKFACNINEQLIRATADRMVALGLPAYGYNYLNLDDCWAGFRDANGNIQPDPKAFPSGMKALGDYIHSKGLKYGVYSDCGVETCAGRPGSFSYEVNDANSYASWGVDYLKYDNCNHANNNQIPEQLYPPMRDALNKTGRPILFSMCEWGVDSPALWAPVVGNSWRTTGDIKDNWESMLLNLDLTAWWTSYAGPGGFNDPDMLEVGNGGMTNTEYTSHFSLWCLIKSPLLIGCDLVNIDNATLSILTNAEAIAINQDPLGVSGRRVWSSSLPQAEGSKVTSTVPTPVPGSTRITGYPTVDTCSLTRADQKWIWDGYHGQFRSYDGQCLTINECSTSTNGNIVSLQPCMPANYPHQQCQGLNQKWTIGTPSGPNAPSPIISYLQETTAPICLDIWELIGPNVQAYPCNNQENQQWLYNSTDNSIRAVDGRCLSVSGTVPAGVREVWAGPLSNGDVAVILFNRGDSSAPITAQFADVGIWTASASVRDLWAHADLGVFNNSFTTTVSSHGVSFLRMTPIF